MAADLAAAPIIGFIVFLAPQVRTRINNQTYFQQHAGRRMTLKAMKRNSNPINKAQTERRIKSARTVARLSPHKILANPHDQFCVSQFEPSTSAVTVYPVQVFQRLTTPRGLPKYAEVVQDSRFCGSGCGSEITDYYQTGGLPASPLFHLAGRIYLFHEREKNSNLPFVKTIVVANQKGCSGKSTSTVHLAVAAEEAGHGSVVISDTDPQGSTADWFNQRKRSGINASHYAPLALSDLSNGIKALAQAGASYLFIDRAPSIGSFNADLFANADLIHIPLNPTPTDLRALVKGLPTIKESGKPFNLILGRVRPNLRNNDGVAMALEALGLVLPARMHERVIYAESFAHGKTAFEIEPKGISSQELAAIWKSLKERVLEKKKVRSQERENVA